MNLFILLKDAHGNQELVTPTLRQETFFKIKRTQVLIIPATTFSLVILLPASLVCNAFIVNICTTCISSFGKTHKYAFLVLVRINHSKRVISYKIACICEFIPACINNAIPLHSLEKCMEIKTLLSMLAISMIFIPSSSITFLDSLGQINTSSNATAHLKFFLALLLCCFCYNPSVFCFYPKVPSSQDFRWAFNITT